MKERPEYPRRSTDTISNINVCPLTEEEYMVYPLSRNYHEAYLCVYILDYLYFNSCSWVCYKASGNGEAIESRLDLGQLFKWISQDITNHEIELG